MEVISDNEKAIKLFKKIGFIKEGRLIKDSYYGNGKYLDLIIMAYLDI